MVSAVLLLPWFDTPILLPWFDTPILLPMVSAVLHPYPCLCIGFKRINGLSYAILPIDIDLLSSPT